MMLLQTALVALSALGLAAAQGGNFTLSAAEIASLDPGTKADWCRGEFSTCDFLCAKSWNSNSCNATTLDYSCVCTNGSAPGLQYYQQSMPYFFCVQTFDDCIKANVGNQQGQSNCTSSIKDQCGTLNPANATGSTGSSTTSTSSSASSSGTGGAKTTSSGGSATTSSAGQNGQSSSSTTSASTSKSTSGARATQYIQYIGNGAALAVAGGLFAYAV